MTPADLERVHMEILGFERIEAVSDEMRALIESEWPELVHKLPPKEFPDAESVPERSVALLLLIVGQGPPVLR